MKDHSDAQIGDNAEKKFKEYNDVLSDIETSLCSAAKLQKKSNEATYVALGKALELGRIFAGFEDDFAALKEYLQYQDQPWTAKSDSNFFHGIVSVAFDIINPKTNKSMTAAPQLSKYRMILKHAFKHGMTSDQLVTELSSSSINELYDKAAEGARLDPFEKYAEKLPQQFARAKQSLLNTPSSSSLPSGKFSQSMPMPISKTGFVPAMIHVNNNRFQLVKLYTGVSDEKVMTDVAALVPDEAKLARGLLSKEPAYVLFATCDIFQRFLPKIAAVEDWERATQNSRQPVLGENPSAEEMAAYMDWWRENRSEAKPYGDEVTQEERDAKALQMAKKFILLDALQFRQTQTGWHGTSITTQPFNPSFELQFDRRPQRPLFDRPLSIPSRIAAQFVEKFPHETPWKLIRKAKGLALRSHDGKQVFPASDVEGVVTWRNLDPELVTLASYELTKPMLENLHLWKSEFAKLKLHGRNAFHRYQLLCVEDDGLQLALPDRDDHRCDLGQLVSKPLIDRPEGLRFADFHMVRKLIQLTMDYGVTYQIDLLAGHQGLTGLKFHIRGLPMAYSITLPLMLTQKGNPVEINMPM
ncbi:hypothetical protein [uncultured Roseobacter sp.]|uniref:hypothetical protein n=1 Tax=uncultured Roseobacter sp. TaxID=114847 RepID=UPI002610A503|nr:hypothetical protein [uncultured Roseobacter sp.]